MRIEMGGIMKWWLLDRVENIEVEIDFVAGSHGNFLEFALAKLVTDKGEMPDTPFNELGSSHKKPYVRKVFYASHFCLHGGTTSKKVIRIVFKEDDLLPLSSISFERSNDRGINNNELHIDTYNKLNNENYRSTLDGIISSYNVLDGYADIKADEWPNITTIEEFANLPEHIKEECKTVYGFSPKPFNEEHPDMPRSKLREFFKFGFKYPEQNGLIHSLNQMKFSDSQLVYDFPFADIYNFTKFNEHVQNIGELFEMTFNDFDLKKLHSEFMKRQPYHDIKIKTDKIIDNIKMGGDTVALELTLLQESYINAKLELLYNLEMPANSDIYFPTTNAIYEYITK